MTDKTDAEFIAECEAYIEHQADWGRVWDDCAEAVERLKRAIDPISRIASDPKFERVSSPVDIIALEALADRDKHIAELKGLLAWCRSEAIFAHCDEQTIARIDELISERAAV